MPAYLITGRGGVGKSTICKELQLLGYVAFDADEVPGLSRWEDRKTSEPTRVDTTGFVDFKKVAWNWNAKILNELLGSHDVLFLCGSASNQDDYHDQFERIFVLMPDQGSHRQRLQTRQSNYGKDPAMTDYLLTEHQKFAKELIQNGATAVDANGTPSQTVNLILGTLHEHKSMA